MLLSLPNPRGKTTRMSSFPSSKSACSASTASSPASLKKSSHLLRISYWSGRRAGLQSRAHNNNINREEDSKECGSEQMHTMNQNSVNGAHKFTRLIAFKEFAIQECKHIAGVEVE
jgi:hypothetical protein